MPGLRDLMFACISSLISGGCCSVLPNIRWLSINCVTCSFLEILYSFYLSMLMPLVILLEAMPFYLFEKYLIGICYLPDPLSVWKSSSGLLPGLLPPWKLLWLSPFKKELVIISYRLPCTHFFFLPFPHRIYTICPLVSLDSEPFYFGIACPAEGLTHFLLVLIFQLSAWLFSKTVRNVP